MDKCYNIECCQFNNDKDGNCRSNSGGDDCGNFRGLYKSQELLAVYRFVLSRQLERDTNLMDTLKSWQPKMHEIIMDDIKRNNGRYQEK